MRKRPDYGNATSDAEILAAVCAPVRHGLPLGNLTGLSRTAMSAAPLVIPQSALKPFGGHFLIGKHIHKLNNGDAFSVGFSCCFRPLFRVAGSSWK